jgi:outer membrane protein assembly factor BamD
MYSAGMTYYEQGEYLKAQTLFEQVISAYRGRKQSEELYFKYAYTHYYLNQFILGAYYFRNFSETFTNSDFREEALYMSAYCNYKLSPTYRLDQEYTETAIDEFQLFVNTFPNSDRVQKCNELIDELRKKLERKAIARAELYYNMGRYKAAVQSYTLALQDYPETDDAEEIRFKMAKAGFRLAENSIYSKKRERYKNTLDLANQFLLRYPRSEYTDEVRRFKEISEEEIKTLIDG